jgi:type VI secretion system protein ImpM
MSQERWVSMRTQAEPAGWFGKLACLGDFGSRRLPQTFVQACDDWLSRCLVVSRSQLGTRWLDTYLTAPVWRFAWAPGVVDDQWWFGAMMPSCDNVGRYFPLVVARPDRALPNLPPALARLDAWYASIVQTMLDTLQPDASLESFDAALAQASGAGIGIRDEPQVQRLAGRIRHVAETPGSLNAWLPAVAVPMWAGAMPHASLWWPVQSNAAASALSLAQGLPTPEHFVELLEGSW